MTLNLDLKATTDGAWGAVLSAPSVDRDGEIVDPFAFNPLPDHIPIDIDHALSVEKTVGSGTPFYDTAGMLRLRDLSFASTPLGQTVKTLVAERHIRTMSVAFGSARYEVDEKDGIRHVRSAELYNAAIVAVPSNRDAFIHAAKAAKLDPAVILEAATTTVVQEVAAEIADGPAGLSTKTTSGDDSAATAPEAVATVSRPAGYYTALADAYAASAGLDY